MPSDEYGLPLETAITRKGISTATIACLIDATPNFIIQKIDYQTLLLALDCQGKNADTIALLLNRIWPVENKNGLLVHRACSGKSSLRVLQSLLEAWPEAVSIRDDFGNLLLHHACTTTARDEDSVPKIQVLVKQWPGALQVKTLRGMLPLHIACSELGQMLS